MKRIPSLDGMRAVAILIVFLHHAGVRRVLIPGPFGVTIFFFLSGYLITTLMRTEHERTGRLDLGAFYLRRLIRIFPSLYFTLAVTWLLGATVSQLVPASLQIGNYWMIAHGVYSLPAGLGVLWSLAVEEHFYLLFPLVFIAITKTQYRAGIVWALCAVCFAWRCLLIRRGVDPLHLAMATDARFDSLLFGCALALRGNPVLDSTRFSKAIWVYALLPLGLAFVGVGQVVPEAAKYSMQGIGLTLVFSAAIRHHSWGPMALLNTRAAVWLGTISYSFYLTHCVVLNLLPFERGTWQLQSLGFALSLGAAWLLHVLVERPSSKLRHRVRVSIPSGELEKLATSQKSNAA